MGSAKLIALPFYFKGIFMWRNISKIMVAGLLFTSLVGCSASNGEKQRERMPVIIRKVILPLLLHQVLVVAGI